MDGKAAPAEFVICDTNPPFNQSVVPEITAVSNPNRSPPRAATTVLPTRAGVSRAAGCRVAMPGEVAGVLIILCALSFGIAESHGRNKGEGKEGRMTNDEKGACPLLDKSGEREQKLGKRDLMKRFVIFLLLAGLFAGAGCARHYVIKLNNGSQITAANKPRLKNGSYYFKDANGQTRTLPAGRVMEIAPASMVQKEKEPFKPETR